MWEDWLPYGGVKQQQRQEVNCLLGMQNNTNMEDLTVLQNFNKIAM